MVATQFTGAERRALRWMGRRGQRLQPSPAAFDLLVARLTVRWRAGWAVLLPAAVLTVGWIGWWSPSGSAAQPVAARVGLALVPVLAFGVAQIGFVARCRRGDRRLAAGLSSRVVRPQAVRVWTVLGPLATAAVVIALAVHGTIVLELARRASAASVVAYASGVVAVSAVVGAGVAAAVRRPTVAVDDSALALDERLRATDALFGLWPLFWVGTGLLSGLDLPPGVASGEVLWLSTGLILLSGLVGFSHPGERARYARGGVWGPV